MFSIYFTSDFYLVFHFNKGYPKKSAKLEIFSFTPEHTKSWLLESKLLSVDI